MDLPIWKPHKQAKERRSSAIELTRVLVENRGKFVESHYQEMLKICIWKYTEAEGPSKHKTRYRSTGSLRSSNEKLNHEHVVTSKSIRSRIMENPEDFERILHEAIACTVLVSEHRLLNQTEKRRPELNGWDRYRAAGIEVWDLLEGVRVV